MPEIVSIPLSDLIVDLRNARLKDEQPSEQSALLALAKLKPAHLLKLAEDIVEHGLDPTTLPVVVPTGDQKKRYCVLEGNRRISALKALETPSLVAPVFKAADRKKLHRLAEKFAKHPINSVKCVLFESEEEATRWITLRHTGPNEGVGIVPWGSEEKDRYLARHGRASPHGQILRFVEQHGALSAEARQSNKRVITNLKRLISDPVVREKLGIEIVGGQVQSWFPAEEVLKGLSRIVDDLRTGKIKVGDIYYKQDRATYIASLPKDQLPDPARRLSAPQPLDATATPVPRREASGKRRVRPKSLPATRTTVIPSTCQLDIPSPRINQIYTELLQLSADQFPNLCSVGLRVFVELSVDHYIEQMKLMSENERRNKPLAKRMKVVAAHMRQNGIISDQLEAAVNRIADNSFVLGASIPTFNLYVHNPYVFPKPTELRLAFDELQPFIERLWP